MVNVLQQFRHQRDVNVGANLNGVAVGMILGDACLKGRDHITGRKMMDSEKGLLPCRWIERHRGENVLLTFRSTRINALGGICRMFDMYEIYKFKITWSLPAEILITGRGQS